MPGRKGQISFDMVFAILAMLIFVQFLSGFADDFVKAQSTISLRDQAFSIGVEVKDVISACQFLKRGTGQAEVRFKLPFLYSTNGKAGCNINSVLSGGVNNIEVKPFIEGGQSFDDAVALIPVPELSVTIAQANCGKEFIFTC
ncbi:MAG: hypothetical protein Q7K42_01355 [Candidatus Diapherotrites archaeon]|nr:hypothetical protein [Candidatus Diapherotrites archaeon]